MAGSKQHTRGANGLKTGFFEQPCFCARILSNSSPMVVGCQSMFDIMDLRGRRRRCIWGRRKEVPRSLYQAEFIASRYDPALKYKRRRMENAGKPFKVVIIAIARLLHT